MKKSLMDAPIHPSVQYTYLLTVNSNGFPVICTQPLNESLKEHDFFGIMFLLGRVEDATLDSSGTDYEMVLLLYH